MEEVLGEDRLSPGQCKLVVVGLNNIIIIIINYSISNFMFIVANGLLVQSSLTSLCRLIDGLVLISGLLLNFL